MRAHAWKLLSGREELIGQPEAFGLPQNFGSVGQGRCKSVLRPDSWHS